MRHATRAHTLARSRMGRCTQPTAQYMGCGPVGLTARRRTIARPLAIAYRIRIARTTHVLASHALSHSRPLPYFRL
jgi:hypothetical protein